MHSQVPTGVRDVIRLRLSRLPEATVSLLDVAATAGRRFDIEVIAAAAGVDEERAIDAIEPALLVGVVLEEPTLLGRYRFSHSLVRETLYGGLPASRRARLHRALGYAHRATGGDEQALEVAHHLFAASGGRASDEAFDRALRAAEQSAAVLAFEQAEEELGRAVALARRMTSGDEACRRELTAQARLGSMLLMTKGYTAPEEHGVDSGIRAVPAGAGCARGPDDQLGCVVVRLRPGRVRQSAEPRRRAPPTRPAERGRPIPGRGHQTLGIALWHVGRLAESEEEFRALAAITETLPESLYTSVMLSRDPVWRIKRSAVW